MDRNLSSTDNRRFGRRRTLWHAWVSVPGREREPCRVRNLSVEGALLEFERTVPCAGRFKLTIEETGFEVDCSVRHRGSSGLGVYFNEASDAFEPPCLRAHRDRAFDLVKQFRRGGRAMA